MLFNELDLPDYIMKAIDDMGFTEPTEIQYKAIPSIIAGRDIIGKSRTGTGKTAAFSIPAIININEDNKNNVTTLVLCPTRELAMQVCEQVKHYSKYKKIVKVLPVFGGQSYDKQISGLRRGANIVVGTPGRIIDHIKRRTLLLSNIETIILDEADEMLNMGFKEDIETILEKANKDRQTILFSATMPKAIMNITKEYQNDPVIVDIKTNDDAPSLIKQYYCSVKRDKKVDALYVLLKYLRPRLSIVFCNTKRMVDEMEIVLNSLGYNAAGIHGDMKQNVRTTVMSKFKTGKLDVLIATDVAARGIDVSNVDIVFNYDVPQDVEYYVHRIGRTGRAGKEGRSFTIVNGNAQLRELLKIKKATKSAMEYFEVPTPEMVLEKNNEEFASKLFHVVNDFEEVGSDEIYEYLKTNDLSDEQIAKALIKHAIPKAARNIPYVENLKDMNISNDRGTFRSSRGSKSDEKHKPVQISLGKKMGISANHILGAITEGTGIAGSRIGKISILSDFSLVDVPEECVNMVIDKINKTKINNKVVNVTSVSDSSRHSGHSNRRSGNYGKSRPKLQNYSKPKRR